VNGDVLVKRAGPKFKLEGSALWQKHVNIDYMTQGRAVPTALSLDDPIHTAEAYQIYNEVRKNVDLKRIFKGTVSFDYVHDLDFEERAKREEAQIAAVLIQRNYRKHLRDKRFIENRLPRDPAMVKWAREYKNEINRRRAEKQKSLKDQKAEIKKENAAFKKYLNRIGAHADIHE
jgi:hypothetical protein